MMSDAELRRFAFFRWAGAFSVDASSPRAARAAVLYAGEQAQQGAGVWIFPQGVLGRGTAPSAFTSGFVHAARAANAPIVPVAMVFRMLDKQRPEAFVDIGQPLDAGQRDAQRRTQAECCRAGRAHRQRHCGGTHARALQPVAARRAGRRSARRRDHGDRTPLVLIRAGGWSAARPPFGGLALRDRQSFRVSAVRAGAESPPAASLRARDAQRSSPRQGLHRVVAGAAGGRRRRRLRRRLR